MNDKQTTNEAADGRSDLTAVLEALPCPFCGKAADMEDPDTLHPSGSGWRDDEVEGFRTYHGHKDRLATDNRCWEMNCPTPSGGCGAEMHGDSREEAIAKWNRRANAGAKC